MIKAVKYIFLLCICILLLAGCAPKSNYINQKKYSEITVTSSKGDYADIFSLSNSNLNKVDSIYNLSDIVFDYNSSVYAYILNCGKGETFNQNKIILETKDGEQVISNFFTAMDPKISPQGEKIAYRSFLKDSYDSAAGLTVYDINSGRNLNLKTSILVSGNLYNWLNSNEIIYYGISTKVKGYDKLYKYNFKKNTEEVYMSNIQGFCTYFTLVSNKGVIDIEENGDDTNLYYNDLMNKNKTLISNSISDIYFTVYNEKNNSVYFIGVDKSDDIPSLYKISIKDLSLTRLTYDFPKEADIYGGLLLDSSGNVYFCGEDDSDNSINHLYMYNITDQSINLINSPTGRYYLGGNNK